MKKLYFFFAIAFAWSNASAQNVGVDVASPAQKLDVAGAIKIGSTTTGVAGSLRWTGTEFQFHDGTNWISLNANTDDQVLDVIQLNGTDLEISIENDGQATYAIDLSSFLDNTDAQQFDQVSINGSNQLLLSLSNDGQATHVLDLSGYLDNTDQQQFDIVQLSGTNLELSLQNDGLGTHVIDLSSLAVDTDDQALDVAQLTGTNLELSLEDDGVATEVIDLSGFMDNTDNQTFDVANITSDELRLSLEDDAQPTVVLDLAPYKDNTDDQQFDVVQLSGNNLELSLEDDGQATHSIDLSGFADNTDDQTIDVLSMSGNTLNLSLEGDGQPNQTLDLSQFADNTDDQAVTTFALSGTDLQLQVEDDAGGLQSVDLSSLQTGLEDTDGDTKVDVEATADEDQIRFSTSGGEAMRINTTQQVGIGLSTGIENRLVVQGSTSDARAVLGLRGGNAVTTFNGGPQIAFGYDGDDSYQHFIHTRHNSAGGSVNNAIDFYVSDGTQYNTVTSGSTHVMSLNSGNVGVGITAPGRELDVAGNIRVSGLSSSNQLVISDADGDLVNTSSLVGTGMGDNLGNHTATANLNMTNREIDNITQLDMTAGNGNGVRFWSSNDYKISMGNSADYRYGDVQDYSIKMSMNNDAEQDRGWTWGINGVTPVASLSEAGHLTLDGSLYLDCINCGSTSDPYPTGGSGWGNMVLQGRVMSADANIHISPPGGSNVIIDDTYRAGGGSGSAAGAGLQVERLAGGGNRIVMTDNAGVLYPLANLNGSGLGDNLGNHTATTTITMNGNDLDFVRGDVGQIRSVGTISFDWTSGTYDSSPNHGIESKDENGNMTDDLRINSYDGVVVTLDANNNNGTSAFKVQHHSTGNGSDLLQINSPDGRMWFGRGNGGNRMYLDDNGIYLYNGWFRNHGATGLYNQSYGNHWYAENASYWISRSNSGIAIRNVGNTTRGYLYHDNGDSFGLLDRDGNWALRTVRDQYVELLDNNEVMFRAGQGGVTGNYGSVQTYGAGKGGWDGYSVEGRYVLMSNGNETFGMYNDVDNRWIQLFDRNSYHRIYDSNGDDYVEFDNNCQLNFRDNNIWDVERLTVNTIYSIDDSGGDPTGDYTLHLVDRIRVDLPSGQDFYVSNDDGRTTLRSQSANHGQVGRLQNYWYRSYVRYNYRLWEGGFSDRRVKENIRDLDSRTSLGKIMQLRGKKFDLSKNHPMVANGEIQNETDRILMKDNLGFIAQELQEIVPEMVITDEESGYLIVMNYEQLFPIVIEAMQEQQRQIEELKGNKRPKNYNQVDSDKAELSEMVRALIETTENQQRELEELKAVLKGLDKE